MVIYHLQNGFGKYGWNVNGTELFFQRKIYRSNGKSETVVLFFQTPEFRVSFFQSFQSHLWNQSQAFAAVFGKWNWFVQKLNAIPGRNLPVLNFAYHLPEPGTYRFALVNGKWPMFLLYGGFICKTRRAGCVWTRVFLLREERFSKNGEGVYLSKLWYLKRISPSLITTV